VLTLFSGHRNSRTEKASRCESSLNSYQAARCHTPKHNNPHHLVSRFQVKFDHLMLKGKFNTIMPRCRKWGEFFSLPSALDGGWVVNATSPPFCPLGMTRCLLYRRLFGPQGRFGRLRKTSPPPGFDPHIFQPVACRYTDWAVQTCVPSYDLIFSHSTLGPVEVQSICWQDEHKFSLSMLTIKGHVLIKLLSAETIRY
jgi:hypothetical protein